MLGKHALPFRKHMMSKIDLVRGSLVSAHGFTQKILAVTDLSHVLIENVQNGRATLVDIAELSPHVPDPPEQVSLPLITDSQWAEALRKKHIVELALPYFPWSEAFLREFCQTYSISRSSLYRWHDLYERNGSASSLLRLRNSTYGSSGVSSECEQIMAATIDDVYCNRQQHSIAATYRELRNRLLKANISNFPSYTTLRRRISRLPMSKILTARAHKKEARDLYRPHPDSYHEATRPLHVVQCDHAKLDIELVDEKTRQPIGRPWLTICIDVNSRVITGYYLAFHPPSLLSVGFALACSILDKDGLLKEFKIGDRWPVYGLPRIVHLDNAKEFRSHSLSRACQEYGINLQFRPIHRPEYGAHVERAIGTIQNEVHSLPGTTFSSPKQRGNYDSEKTSALTLRELEEWLVGYIVTVYHHSKHRGLGGLTPLEHFEAGVLGTQEVPGIPLQLFTDRDKVQMDFLPTITRTVLPDGVHFRSVTYYSDIISVLMDEKRSNKGRFEHFFHYDPRDMSALFYFEPNSRRYVRIPYRNTHPPVSMAEINEARAVLHAAGRKVITERELFAAIDRLKAIVAEAVVETRKVRRRTNEQQRHRVDEATFDQAAAMRVAESFEPVETYEVDFA